MPAMSVPMSRARPSPALPEVSTIRVLLKSAFSNFSGYGQDGWGLARALQRWGCDVSLQPVWVDVPVPGDLLPLLAKPLVPPFDLTINHWDPANLGIARQARECTRLAVAWTMWEFASGAKSGLVPHCKNRSSLRERLKWFDLVLGYDQVSLDALSPYIPRGVNRGILLGGFEAGEWKKAERDWHGDRFGFCMHGALNRRKAPWTAVQAFSELKHEHPEAFEGAELNIHTTVPGVFPEMNKIFEGQKLRVYMETWDHDTMQAFYHGNHCLLAPSWGEGKNLPALEMQATGGVVAATNFGGMAAWMSGDYAYPMNCELTPTFPKHPDAACHAVVDVAECKRVMWEMFNDRSEARRRGDLAARIIPSMLDWSVVVEDLFRRIRDLVPRQGEIVWNLAMECRRPAVWGERADDTSRG